jgi:hypothetical protein
VWTDYTAGDVCRLAQRAKDAAQARRLLAIAAVLDGASREDAAKMSGMDRQTLRDWVIRLHEQRADVSSISRERRPSSTPDTRPFSPASWRRVRSLQSMAWRACGRAIWSRYAYFGSPNQAMELPRCNRLTTLILTVYVAMRSAVIPCYPPLDDQLGPSHRRAATENFGAEHPRSGVDLWMLSTKAADPHTITSLEPRKRGI